jgi:hypothetical protein
MDIHKDCYSAIDLTQQDGPHRRETLEMEAVLRFMPEHAAWIACPIPETTKYLE